MKILVLSPTFPLPLNMGSKIRIYHMLKKLSKRNEITLTSLVQDNSELDHLEDLSELCKAVYPFQLPTSRLLSACKSTLSLKPYRVVKFHHEGLRKKIQEILRSNEFDIVWINFMNMTSYLDFYVDTSSLIVVDQHNADELMWRKYLDRGNLLIKLYAWWNIWKLRHFRNKLAELIDVILSVSEEDAEFTQKWASDSTKVWTVPNGVDLKYFQPEPDENKDDIIMFCGSMDVKMNIDAASSFANQIFPMIKKKRPKSEFWIVGRNPAEKIKKLGRREGIKVTGTVEEVKPHYQKAKVFVTPFQFGGGTKLKIPEAMAMKVPIVSTSIGCQGIDAIDQKHLIVEDDQERFAKAVVELLEDNEKRRYLTDNARRLVEKHYSWESIYKNVEERISKLVKEGEHLRGEN